MRPAADADRGRWLYETGADASGRSLQAQRLGAGPVARAAVACVNCHRPSTMGGIEGGLLVPPIMGDLLFAPGKAPSTHMNMQWMRHQTRSAYTPTLFARALTQGLDPDGKPLGLEMPRYQLDGRDSADLEAYLRARAEAAVPGWRDGRLHLATVFTPEASAARQETVLKVMQAWSQGLRFGSVPVSWQPWVLQGPAHTWAAQLTAFNQRAPVFALVSGAGGHTWEPVQAFCEIQRVACVFPSVDRVPDWQTPPRYTLYLHAGVDGEARMLARWLSAAEQRGPLQQVWRGESASRAVQTLQTQLPASWHQAPPMEWASGGLRAAAARAVALLRVPSLPDGSTSVLWLATPDAEAWLRAHRPGKASQVLLSAQLAPAQAVQVPPAWRGQVRWVSMRAAPAHFYGVLASSLEPWAQGVAARGGVAPVEFADARAAAFLFGDAAGLTQGVLRPDYLIERLETSVQQRTAASVYIHPSLGPGQRVASKGGVLLGFRSPAATAPEPVSAYLRATP